MTFGVPRRLLTHSSFGPSPSRLRPGPLDDIAAIRAVLPADAVIGAVGGVGDESFGAYAAAGIRTFGLGSSLYRPGDDAGTVRRNARRTLAAYDAAFPAGA